MKLTIQVAIISLLLVATVVMAQFPGDIIPPVPTAIPGIPDHPSDALPDVPDVPAAGDIFNKAEETFSDTINQAKEKLGGIDFKNITQAAGEEASQLFHAIANATGTTAEKIKEVFESYFSSP